MGSPTPRLRPPGYRGPGHIEVHQKPRHYNYASFATCRATKVPLPPQQRRLQPYRLIWHRKSSVETVLDGTERTVLLMNRFHTRRDRQGQRCAVGDELRHQRP